MRIEPDPTPRIAAHIDACRAAIDAHVEAQARALRYNSVAHLAGYVGSTVPEWAAEAQAFVAWRDAVWVSTFALLNAADPARPPSIDEVLAALPAWPH